MNEVAQFMHDNIFDTPGWGFDNSTFHAFEKKVFKRQSKWYAQNQTYSTASFEKFFSIVKLICVKFALTKKNAMERKKIRSKRRYPAIPCPNPLCINGGIFEPHDKRQKYCETQCRVNHMNDIRYLENQTTFADEKNLRRIEKSLAKIYGKYVNKDGYCVVLKEIFYYEEIDVMLLVQELKNDLTGQKVKWYYDYGIELHPDDANYYIIHKNDGHE